MSVPLRTRPLVLLSSFRGLVLSFLFGSGIHSGRPSPLCWLQPGTEELQSLSTFSLFRSQSQDNYEWKELKPSMVFNAPGRSYWCRNITTFKDEWRGFVFPIKFIVRVDSSSTACNLESRPRTRARPLVHCNVVCQAGLVHTFVNKCWNTALQKKWLTNIWLSLVPNSPTWMAFYAFVGFCLHSASLCLFLVLCWYV